MTNIQAEWKPGFSSLYKNVDPQKVAEEIMQIGESATPAQIVEKAKGENTELHKCFDWNDKTAADSYRLVQARKVVQFLFIRTTNTKEVGTPVRFFYKTEASDGYKPTRVIMQNVDEYQSLLRRALAELTAFKNKYKTLTELDALFEEIDKLSA